jgi:hypothetical protein
MKKNIFYNNEKPIESLNLNLKWREKEGGREKAL